MNIRGEGNIQQIDILQYRVFNRQDQLAREQRQRSLRKADRIEQLIIFYWMNHHIALRLISVQCYLSQETLGR